MCRVVADEQEDVHVAGAIGTSESEVQREDALCRIGREYAITHPVVVAP